MSNIWISAATPPHVPGPQPRTLTESQKAQISAYAVTTLGYGTGTGVSNAQALTESQVAQISAYAVTVLSYVVNVNTQTLTESQKAQISYAVTNLSYS